LTKKKDRQTAIKANNKQNKRNEENITRRKKWGNRVKKNPQGGRMLIFGKGGRAA